MSRYGEGFEPRSARIGRCITPYLWVADPRQVPFFARAKKGTKESTPPRWREIPRAASHRAVKFSQSTSLCSVRTGAIPRAALRVHSAPAKRLGRAIGWIQPLPTPKRLTFGAELNQYPSLRAQRSNPLPTALRYEIASSPPAPRNDSLSWVPLGPLYGAPSPSAPSQREAASARGPSRQRGACFLFVPFLQSKEKGPGVQGRSARLIYLLQLDGAGRRSTPR